MNTRLLYRILLISLPFIVFSSCRTILEVDDLVVSYQQSGDPLAKSIAISASIEPLRDSTKSVISGSAGTDIVWQSGDQIKVFNSSNPKGVVFTLNASSNGQSTGRFEGVEVSGEGPFYAVYPASVAETLSGSSVSVYIPQKQRLATNSFGQGANVAIAKVDNIGDNFVFKNALGAIKISFTSSYTRLTRIRIQTKAAEPLWGNGTLSMAENTPVLSLAPGNVDNQIIEAKVGDTASYLSAKSYILTVPENTLAEGFILQAMNDNNCWITGTEAFEENRIVRGTILAMPNKTFTSMVDARFLELDKPFGYYERINYGATMTGLSFSNTTCQFATSLDVNVLRAFCIWDYSEGKLFKFQTPDYNSLQLGKLYDDITVESVVGTTQTEPTAYCFFFAQKTERAGWFISEDFKKGFVIELED